MGKNKTNEAYVIRAPPTILHEADWFHAANSFMITATDVLKSQASFEYYTHFR